MIDALSGCEFSGKQQFDFSRAVRVLRDAQEDHEHAIKSHSLEVVQILDGRFRKSVAAFSPHVFRENPHSRAISEYGKTEIVTISDAETSAKRQRTIQVLREEFASLTIYGGPKRNAAWLEREALVILGEVKRNRELAVQKYNSDVVRGVERLESDIRRLLGRTLATPAAPLAASTPPVSVTREPESQKIAPVDPPIISALDDQKAAGKQVEVSEISVETKTPVHVAKVSLDDVFLSIAVPTMDLYRLCRNPHC